MKIEDLKYVERYKVKSPDGTPTPFYIYKDNKNRIYTIASVMKFGDICYWKIDENSISGPYKNVKEAKSAAIKWKSFTVRGAPVKFYEVKGKIKK